jgi:hypothetical protein
MIPSTQPTRLPSPREELLESFKKFSLLNRQTTSPVVCRFLSFECFIKWKYFNLTKTFCRFLHQEVY